MIDQKKIELFSSFVNCKAVSPERLVYCSTDALLSEVSVLAPGCKNCESDTSFKTTLQHEA